MPNTTVPAAAEGVPTEAIIEKRIAELAREIGSLLDQVPKKGQLVIYAASMGQKPRYEFEISLEGPALSSALLEGVDKLGAARGFAELVDLALEGLSADPDLVQAVNALQYGLSGIHREISAAAGSIERARRLAC
ncbi:hypothetical protein [Neorhizobium sp. T25_13]|uniref:hypothetical protein n=1 Tax=Neorhizobium sp. T25_13 TaxID=2093830 RepID=UPI000CF86BCC|nr:hypothetical protein [Neorhizobium sp. T25_13]